MDAKNAAPPPPSPTMASVPAARPATPIFFRALDDFALLLFALLLVVATAQVLFRYVLVMPLPWTEELARFLLVWVTFLGAASITRRKLHIAVDYFIARFPPRSVPPVRCGVYLLMALFLGIFLWGVLIMMADVWPVHAGTMPWLSITFVYLGALIGVTIMLGLVLTHLVSELGLPARSRRRGRERGKEGRTP